MTLAPATFTVAAIRSPAEIVSRALTDAAGTSSYQAE